MRTISPAVILQFLLFLIALLPSKKLIISVVVIQLVSHCPLQALCR
jgi:hypothetical protein